jgi:hypothetical protein
MMTREEYSWLSPEQRGRLKAWLMTTQIINQQRMQEQEAPIPQELSLSIFKQSEPAYTRQLYKQYINNQLLQSIKSYLVQPSETSKYYNESVFFSIRKAIKTSIQEGANPNTLLAPLNTSVYGYIIDNAPQFSPDQWIRLKSILRLLAQETGPSVTAPDVTQKIATLDEKISTGTIAQEVPNWHRDRSALQHLLWLIDTIRKNLAH